MKTCPDCGRSYEDANFCTVCGVPLREAAPLSRVEDCKIPKNYTKCKLCGFVYHNSLTACPKCRYINTETNKQHNSSRVQQNSSSKITNSKKAAIIMAIIIIALFIFFSTFIRGTDSSSGSISGTIGEMNALRSGKSYLSAMPFSYEGLIQQLEFEGYSHSEATFAAEHCGADWKKQAAKQAKQYLDVMSFSKTGLIKQLEFDGFTHEEAVYAVEQVGY